MENLETLRQGFYTEFRHKPYDQFGLGSYFDEIAWIDLNSEIAMLIFQEHVSDIDWSLNVAWSPEDMDCPVHIWAVLQFNYRPYGPYTS